MTCPPQEYARPLVNVPGSWVVNSAIAAVKMLSPTSNFGDTENPYVLTPLVTGAHMVTVSERPLAPEDALPAEDCSLWGAGYAACPGPGARRKVSSPRQRSAHLPDITPICQPSLYWHDSAYS